MTSHTLNVARPTLTQSCILIFLYGTFAFTLFYRFSGEDKTGFEVLIDYSDFMVGVSTIVAALAAVYGVNNWIKQVKHTEYFNLIWDAKRAAGMYRIAYLNWSQYYGIIYHQNDPASVLRNEDYSKALDTRRKELLSVFHNLDAIMFKGEFNWGNASRDFVATVNQYRAILTSPDSSVENNEKARNLIDKIDEHYQKIFQDLELLEQSYS